MPKSKMHIFSNQINVFDRIWIIATWMYHKCEHPASIMVGEQACCLAATYLRLHTICVYGTSHVRYFHYALLKPRCGVSTPIPLFCSICTTNSQQSTFSDLYYNEWAGVDIRWFLVDGFDTRGFQEGFRAVRRDVLESFAERAFRWIAKKGKKNAPKDSHQSVHYSICKSKLLYCWLPRNFTGHLRLLQSSHAQKKVKNSWCGVATISRLLKIIGLFCGIAL